MAGNKHNQTAQKQAPMLQTASKSAKTHYLVKDPLYQIIEATHTTIENPLEQFAYDAAGNKLSDNVKSAYQYNDLNQLTEDDSCWYTYDADGNMTAKVNKLTNDSTVYTWDIESKLTQVRKPGMLAKYTYDALGRRMSKEVNGVVSQFRYDGQDLILEMDAIDAITANYTFGPGIDNPLMMHRDSKNYYYVKDGLGSVTAITDSTGGVVKTYQYSVFGQIVKETGIGILNPFTYTSRERDEETGNYYYRARYYDAKLGRFLSEDPIGFLSGDANFYRYVGNSPVGLVDPFGENQIVAGAIIGGITGGMAAYTTSGGNTSSTVQGIVAGAISGGLVSFASPFASGAIGNAVGQKIGNPNSKVDPVQAVVAGVGAFLGSQIGAGIESGFAGASAHPISQSVGSAIGAGAGGLGGDMIDDVINGFIGITTGNNPGTPCK